MTDNPTRQDQRQRGHAVRDELKLPAPAAPDLLPGFGDFMAEVAYGGIWDRPHLSRHDRMLCTLAVCSPHLRPQLADLIGSALEIGVQPLAMLEVFLQAGLYGGFVTTEAAVEAAREVFESRGVAVPETPPREDSNEALDARGREIMAKLHGERSTGGYAAPGNAITGALYPSAIRYGYGELWDRPGLDHRERMLVAIAAFTGLGLEGQLRKFAQSALNIGLTQNEVIEAVIQTGPYSGFPRALNGLAILTEVFPKG